MISMVGRSLAISRGFYLCSSRIATAGARKRRRRWSELSSFVVVLDGDRHSVVVAHQREVAESAHDHDDLPIKLHGNRRELVVVIRALEIGGHLPACAEAGVERTVAEVSCQPGVETSVDISPPGRD